MTGPVVPSQVVFYGAYQSSLSGTNDDNAIFGSAYTFSSPQFGVFDFGGNSSDTFITSLTYSGSGVDFGMLLTGGVFLNPNDPGAAYSGSVTGSADAWIRGIDVLDASVNSLIGVDQLTFNTGYGTYFLGNPYAGTVPEPTSLALLGTGLLALAPLSKRIRRSA